MSLARHAIRRSEIGADTSVRRIDRENRRRSAASGKAATSSSRARKGISARKSGPQTLRPARIQVVPRPQVPSRARRGREDESGGPAGVAGRESKGDQTAERDSANRRALDRFRVHHREHLVRIAVETAIRFKRKLR